MEVGKDQVQRRQFILGGAFRAFAQDGAAAITTKRVAKQCGLQVGDVTAFFDNDEHLLLGMAQRRDERISEMVAAVGPDAGYRAILDATARGIAADKVAARLTIVVECEALTPHHPLHDYLHMRSVRAADQLRELFEEEFAEPDALALETVAILEGLQLRFGREPEAFDLERHWNSIADALFDGAARRD